MPADHPFSNARPGSLPGLNNAELNWERLDSVQRTDESLVTERLGPTDETIECLSGGLANLNLRVGPDKVLRIYLRDVRALPKELALLQRPWSSLQTPACLERGKDFLLLSYIDHAPLPDMAQAGEQVGRALAEIHRSEFVEHGLFDEDFEIHTSLADFPVSMVEYIEKELAAGPVEFSPEAKASLLHLRRNQQQLTELSGRAVLLHGDFKASNLHHTTDAQLLVLDWEFAYAGPALMDIGQLLRGSPSTTFRMSFARAYRNSGGHLPQDWCEQADNFDLVNLVGLLLKSVPGSRRAQDLQKRLRQTISKGQCSQC